MSEQNQSNFQAFGAGLLGFVAVMAIGGGALMVRSSQQAKAGARPDAAAAPIDLGSAMPRPVASHKERRMESPAPLMGAQDKSEGSEASAEESDVAAAAAAGAAASSSGSAQNAKSAAARLEVTQHLDKPGSGSSATAIVKEEAAPEKKEKVLGKIAGRKVTPKLDTTGGGAVASVHYGVTSRSELMGRAAGPVYNFKGNAKSGGSGAMGKMGVDVKAKVADLQRQMEAAGLPAEQRAKLQKDIEAATSGISEAEKAPQ
jgi:hypothetical protein